MLGFVPQRQPTQNRLLPHRRMKDINLKFRVIPCASVANTGLNRGHGPLLRIVLSMDIITGVQVALAQQVQHDFLHRLHGALAGGINTDFRVFG